MKTAKRLISLVAAAVMALLARGEPAQAAERVKIGMIAPLSGPVASYGVDARRAVSLADELLGRGEFELFFEDDKCLGKDGVSAAQKLLSIDKVNFGMTLCTEPTIATAPIFQRNQTVVVAPGGTGYGFAQSGDYIFRVWPGDDGAVDLLLSHLLKRHRKIGMISEDRGMPQEISRYLLQEAPRRGLTVVPESVQSTDADFRSLSLRLRGQGVQALIVNTDSERLSHNILSQVRALGWEVQIYGFMIFGSNAFLRSAGAPAEGIEFVDMPSVSPASGARFSEVYQEFFRRYGSPQSSEFTVACAITAFTTIMDTARSGQDPLRFLHANEFQGLWGAYRFDERGAITGLRHVLKRVRGGKVEVL